MTLGSRSPASAGRRAAIVSAATMLAALGIGLTLLSQPSGGVRAQGDGATTASTAAPTATGEVEGPTLEGPTLEGPIDTGDPRSEGQGPGLVGEPLLVLLGIVLVGVATVVVTVVLARVTGRA
jgi:hypothetical protein